MKYLSTASPAINTLRTTSAGKVGISSTTPWGLLSVNPNGITGPAFVIGSSTATNLIVTNGGNFGIGTTSPYALLSVAGQAVITATTTIGVSSTATQAGIQIGFGGLCVDNDGACVASTTGRVSAVSYTTGASDLAENYYSSEQILEKGEIVMTIGPNKIARADREYQNSIIGVISTKPGIVLGMNQEESQENQYPVALVGRVPVKVSSENGVINIGDFLTISSKLGVAMKATEAGRVIGIAMENYESGEPDQIMVFVNSHWYGGEKKPVGLIEKIGENLESIFTSFLNWMKDRVVKAKEFIAEKITTKQICLEDDDSEKVCIDKNQLKALLGNIGIINESLPTSEPEPAFQLTAPEYSSESAPVAEISTPIQEPEPEIQLQSEIQQSEPIPAVE